MISQKFGRDILTRQMAFSEVCLVQSTALYNTKVSQCKLQFLMQDLYMLAVLSLRVFKKQHDGYPWEATIATGDELSSDLEVMQDWQDEIDQVA